MCGFLFLVVVVFAYFLFVFCCCCCYCLFVCFCDVVVVVVFNYKLGTSRKVGSFFKMGPTNMRAIHYEYIPSECELLYECECVQHE